MPRKQTTKKTADIPHHKHDMKTLLVLNLILSLITFFTVLLFGGITVARMFPKYAGHDEGRMKQDKPMMQQDDSENMMKGYDQTSWQSMISESCQSFFDGCNSCRRSDVSDAIACTKKFCARFEEPRCLDDEEMQETSAPKPVEAEINL